MKITFWGAVGTVTGSCHEVHANGARFLLDCGLYQGRRQEARERNRRFPFSVPGVSGVVLSHAHIDHSGNLPSLGKNGFTGPIYTTSATADLCEAMLLDSAHIQEKDAEFLNRRNLRSKKLRHASNNGAVEPLYTIEDAERVLPLFRPVNYHHPTALHDGLSYEAYDAGHILGASSVLLHHRQGGKITRLAFSGDIGRDNLPILKRPETIAAADYLIMESTYGGRLHKSEEEVDARLAAVIHKTIDRRGKIIVPAFAVGRTQQLVVLLHKLTKQGRIPQIPIYVDSPLAVNVTEIYKKHVECFDAETRAYLLNQENPFGFANLQYVRDVNESKALNDLREPAVIISASGMCEAGRILHHLRNNIHDPRNTVIIPGFQAENTLGRKILEGWAEVPIFGEPVPLRCEVVKLNELSGHADQHELLCWMKPLVPHLKGVFLVHGEPTQSQALAKAIEDLFGLKPVLPQRGQSFELD